MRPRPKISLTSIMSSMAERAHPVTSLRSLVVAVLPLINDDSLERQLASWLASSASDAKSLPAEAWTSLSKLGLIRLVSADSNQDFTVTNLGKLYLDSIGAGRDVSERLEELERLRTEFLSTVAHELRTPLTSVRTSVGLLMDPTIHADPEIHQTLLENISNSADRMQHLVNDLLDLARVRSGNLYLQVQQFDARELARAAADAVKILTREKRQRLNVTLPKRAVRVMGDRWRLEQALINLLSNASKFSPEDSTIGLKVKLVGGDVEWSVSDEGPGIEPEDMSRLFERFFTRRRDTSGSSSGAGLGLPIALAVAQSHDGTVDVESRPGEGSIFTLRIPKDHLQGSDVQ